MLPEMMHSLHVIILMKFFCMYKTDIPLFCTTAKLDQKVYANNSNYSIHET